MAKRIIIFIVLMSSTILSGCFRFEQHLAVDSQNTTGSMRVNVALDMTLVKILESLHQDNASSDWEKELDDFLTGNGTNPLDGSFAQLSYIKNYHSGHKIDKRSGYLTLTAQFDIINIERFFEANMPNHSIEYTGNRVIYEADINKILGTNNNVKEMRQENQQEDWSWLLTILFDSSWYAISVDTPRTIISTNGSFVSTTEAEYLVTVNEMIDEGEFDNFIIKWYR